MPVVSVATLHPEKLERTCEHDQVKQQTHNHEDTADLDHPLLGRVHLEIFGEEVDEPDPTDAEETEGTTQRPDQQFLSEGS